jgi:type III pantothenate kinase
MMEGLIARMKAQTGRPMRVIATGGLATLFNEHSDIFDEIDGDLTLQGLAMLADRSRAA